MELIFKIIKAVIFDLDGVYFSKSTKEFLDVISSKFNVDRENVSKIYLKSNQIKEYKKGKIEGEVFWSYFLNELNINSTLEEIIEILKQSYEVNPLAKKLLKSLKEQDIKTIICTNNFKERIEVLDGEYNFVKDFDFAIFSYDFGTLKPALLEKVIEKSNLKPEEILLLDDKPENILGAEKIGMKAKLCNNPKELENHLAKFGVNI